MILIRYHQLYCFEYKYKIIIKKVYVKRIKEFRVETLQYSRHVLNFLTYDNWQTIKLILKLQKQ